MKPQNIALNSQGRPFLIDVGQLANQVRPRLVTADASRLLLLQHSRAPRATRAQRGASSARSSGSRCASKQVPPCASHPQQMKPTNSPFCPSHPLRFQHVELSAPPEQGVYARDDIESVRSIFLQLVFLCKRLLHLCSCSGSWPISSGAAATASGSVCALTQEQSHAFGLTSLIFLRFPPNLERSWKLASVLWRSLSVPVARPRLRCSGCWLS